jgi:hypothetical protein
MKATARFIFPLFLALLMAATVSAIVIKDRPTAQSNGTDVTIRWNTSDEGGVVRFDVLRRSGTAGDFTIVGSVDQLKGNNSTYEFVDKSAFKTTGGFYQYKVRIINGQVPAPETEIVPVAHLTSTYKRTWGSIKAMFR